MTVVHCKKAECTHYIGRPSLCGNPYSHRPSALPNTIYVATATEAITLYEAYARSQPHVMAAIKRLPEYAVLGCWCKPNPCHGDIIVKLWKELNA